MKRAGRGMFKGRNPFFLNELRRHSGRRTGSRIARADTVVSARRRSTGHPKGGLSRQGIHHSPFIPGMNFKSEPNLPSHLESNAGLPRNREERLLWIRRKVEEGYYDDTRVIRAVVDAFLEPNETRRAGDRSWRQAD